MSKLNSFAIINQNKQFYQVKRSYFLDLLSYLIAALAGYYLNSVPIIGVFLSPFILFLLKVALKKSTTLGSKGILVWVIWFLIGFPATFFTYFLDGKYHIATPLNKKYLTLKKEHGSFADHFPEDINFKKDIAKVKTHLFRGGLFQMPSHFAIEIQYLDNLFFQEEINRLKNKSEAPPKDSCPLSAYNELINLKKRPWETTTYWLSKNSSEKKSDYLGYQFLFFSNNGIFRCDDKSLKATIKAVAIDSNKKIIRYFARPF